LVIALVAAQAGATVTNDQCVDANSDGQALRLDGKFAEARQKFETCGDPSCPSIVHEDCTKRLKDLDAAQPTIVFDVKDAAGGNVAAVAVSIDDRPLTSRLDGTAVRVDPGDHRFTFTADDAPPVTRRLTIKEGEKDRHERIVLGPTGSTGVPLAPPQGSAESASASGPGMGTQKILGLTAGGVGVAGIVLGSVFGALTLSAASRQKSDCGSTCTSVASHESALSDHSSAVTEGAASTVGFIAGGALLVTGVVLFFTAGSPSSEKGSPAVASASPRGGWVVLPIAGPRGGGLSLRWEL
jgi:hypothetical protein